MEFRKFALGKGGDRSLDIALVGAVLTYPRWISYVFLASGLPVMAYRICNDLREIREKSDNEP